MKFIEEVKQITELRKKENLTEEECIKKEILRCAEQGINICTIDDVEEDNEVIAKLEQQGFNVVFKHETLWGTYCLVSW